MVVFSVQVLLSALKHTRNLRDTIWNLAMEKSSIRYLK